MMMAGYSCSSTASIPATLNVSSGRSAAALSPLPSGRIPTMPSHGFTAGNAIRWFSPSTGNDLLLRHELLLSIDQVPWFPGLADVLACDRWARVAWTGIDAGSYGTQRWLDGSPTASRNIVAGVPLGGDRICYI